MLLGLLKDIQKINVKLYYNLLCFKNSKGN